MKALVQTSKGSSKKQLAKVLKEKETNDEELDEYIVEGRKYLKTLDDKVDALKNLQKGLE